MIFISFVQTSKIQVDFFPMDVLLLHFFMLWEDSVEFSAYIHFTS